jgi:hypothetical protein
MMDPRYACCVALEEAGGPYDTLEECQDSLYGARPDQNAINIGFTSVTVIVLLLCIVLTILMNRDKWYRGRSCSCH